ncbi:MAG: hypothetical protein H0W61_12955 [Bacteroidetes bacterium]|nr:hypothetical protein [Bacteroidota bacterium]
MKRLIKAILFTACLSFIFISGCKKKETVEVDNETQSSVDNAVADQEYAAIVPAVNNHAINTKGTGVAGRFSSTASSPCDTLTWLNRATADTNLVNGKYVKAPLYELNLAGACGSSFSDGKIRTGKWTIRITGPMKNVGSQMIIKLVNHKTNSTITYACDSMVITTISSSTLSSTFNIKLINGVCSSSSWTIKYSSDRTLTHYIHGNPYGSDPLTSIYGTANGINRQGRAFTVNIPQNTPLTKYKSCQYIQKGILTLTPEGFKERIVDFGYSISPNVAGGCDDDASFTVNGNTVAFKLK